MFSGTNLTLRPEILMWIKTHRCLVHMKDLIDHRDTHMTGKIQLKHCVVFLSKTFYPLLSNGLTQEDRKMF